MMSSRAQEVSGLNDHSYSHIKTGRVFAWAAWTIPRQQPHDGRGGGGNTAGEEL